MQRRTTKEEHRKRHRKCRTVRDHRTRNRGCNSRVDYLNRFRAAHLAEVFTNTVENNHGFVNGVTQHGQHCRQNRKRKFPVHHGKNTDHNHDVVQVGDDGGNCELPFESHRQVNDDAGHNEQQSRQAVGCKFFTDLRTHELVVEHLDAGSGFLKRLQKFSGHLTGRFALLHRKTNHDVTSRTVVLHGCFNTEFALDLFADLFRLNSFRILHHNLGAARKLNGQSQTVVENPEHGNKE